ncbi:MAG: 23S rRNA (guanosine(2251)-2'-O)-methyltransferase RlmB [Erysipelotrichaceae bacterium]|nr:23S rRNA (guanosine(2251)-2'-O)-methyltransferase RlmB [Erysipelotrichaceae bacterium]
MEYIFGKNTIDSFIDGDSIIEIFILKNFTDEKLLKKIRQKNIKVSVRDRIFFEKIAQNGKHQGIIASIKEYKYASLSEIIENGKKTNYPLIVALDGIEDPHNVGAIIRTCEAFSVSGIIILKHNCCPINATVAKVSTGAIANVKIAQVTNLTNALKELKNNGYWVYAAEATNSQSYTKYDYKSPTVLVVGSEGHGISRLVKQQADFNIAISMTGKVNSLNVSVATAILLSHISLKQNISKE